MQQEKDTKKRKKEIGRKEFWSFISPGLYENEKRSSNKIPTQKIIEDEQT